MLLEVIPAVTTSLWMLWQALLGAIHLFLYFIKVWRSDIGSRKLLPSQDSILSMTFTYSLFHTLFNMLFVSFSWLLSSFILQRKEKAISSKHTSS